MSSCLRRGGAAAQRAAALGPALEPQQLHDVRVRAILRDHLGLGAQHTLVEGPLRCRYGVARSGQRLLCGGHRVVAHNRSRGPVDELASKGADPAYSVEELVGKLQAPRAVWIMLPAGDVTEQMIRTLIPLLEAGDTIIDGGNTNFNDDMRRAAMLKEHGLGYIDQGTSGGVWGLENGFCIMVGGEEALVKRLDMVPLLSVVYSPAGARGDKSSLTIW